MNKLLQFFSRVYSWRVRLLEKKIGYRVEFTYIPDIWVNGLVRFNMGPRWEKQGIQAIGVNYFTVGALTEGKVSSRYIDTEKQYQSWLGAYLVKFKEDRDFTLQDHFNLAIADQKNWLADFGDPNPYIEMSAENVASSEPIQIGEYQGTLYYFSGGHSHTDVGSKSNNSRSRLVMTGAALRFNTSNPQLDIRYKNLIPKNIKGEYKTVVLRGYIAIIELEKKTKVVLYGNGAAVLDEMGMEVRDFTPSLKEEICGAFKAVRVHKL